MEERVVPEFDTGTPDSSRNDTEQERAGDTRTAQANACGYREWIGRAEGLPPESHRDYYPSTIIHSGDIDNAWS